jgi:hypothetical protein
VRDDPGNHGPQFHGVVIELKYGGDRVPHWDRGLS